MRYLRFLRHLLHVALLLARRPGTARRLGILAGTARLSLSAARHADGDGSTRSVRLLGYAVAHVSPRDLLHAFEDVFVHGAYRLEAGTAAPLVIDCGANVGLSVLYFKLQYPRARVLAFEPSPATCALLRRNVESNQLRDVCVEQAAVGAAAGELLLHSAAPGSLRASTSPARAGGQQSTVEVVPLSAWMDAPVDLLKLDVEGAELDVLSELHRSGALGRVSRIAMEYHHHLDGEGDRLASALDLLEANGFGYLLDVKAPERLGPDTFQDIMVYAYRDVAS